MLEKLQIVRDSMIIYFQHHHLSINASLHSNPIIIFDNFMQNHLQNKVFYLTHQSIRIEFSYIISQPYFGYLALFQEKQIKRYFQVHAFSKSLVQISKFQHHLERIIKQYKALNSKIVSPIIQTVEDKENIYVICQVQKYTLLQLVGKRQGLTDFQAVFYLLDFFQYLNYLKTRDFYLQKVDISRFYLSKSMKLIYPFSVYLNFLAQENLLRYIPFRNEKLNENICKQLRSEKSVGRQIEYINSWNLGIFLFQLIQNRLPFKSNYSIKELQNIPNQLSFKSQVSPEIMKLIKKFLVPTPNHRIKPQLMFLQPLLKKYSQLPHILPTSIFSCPPSDTYKITYNHLKEENKLKEQQSVLLSQEFSQLENIKTTHEIINHQEQDIVAFNTIKYLKNSQRSLTQTKVYIQEFVDISHLYGYAYQLNTGQIGFVYNDETQFYFFNNGTNKIIHYVNEHKQMNTYFYDKLPQQQELKKKLYILQAYIKSIKKYKAHSAGNEKLVTVRQYAKTKNAAIFNLSNDNIQVLFIDKICFLITRNSIYFKWKNSEKFQNYQRLHDENPQYKIRKQYTFMMAKKLFNSNLSNIEGLEHRTTNSIDIQIQNI